MLRGFTMTTVQTPKESVIEEATDMIDRVLADARAKLLKAVECGALNITEDTSTHIALGKVVAKAVLLDAIDNQLTLGKRDKEVKNLRSQI
jgi:hypothetical protein